MARALYSDLFLIFTPPATTGLINRLSIAAFITTLYKKAATVANINYAATGTLLDDERIKGIIITRASAVVNQWFASTSIKFQSTVNPPKFDLSREDRADIRGLLTVSFGFASREDIPLQEIGDGN